MKRFNLPTENQYGDEIPEDWLYMEEQEDGEYMKYEDHLAIVDRLKQALRTIILAERVGMPEYDSRDVIDIAQEVLDE